ncbi:MAG: hypothetical protein HOQ45_18875, partial [Nocardioidaceae bacterium]|nr:hypothetical protein [Nocardioidaceae bacterium]
GDGTVPVYYAGDTAEGPRLFREHHRAGPDIDPALAALRLADTAAADDPDLRSPWPEGTDVLSVTPADAAGPVVVDVSGGPSDWTSDDAQLALQQLAWTVHDVRRTAAALRVTEDGVTVATVTRSPADVVLALVQVDAPADGATVASGSVVRGRASAFEANVQWELTQDGSVVKRGFTTARECCRLAPYSFRFPDVAAGTYTLVVHDEDVSDGEGGPPAQDTRRVTVE